MVSRVRGRDITGQRRDKPAEIQAPHATEKLARCLYCEIKQHQTKRARQTEPHRAPQDKETVEQIVFRSHEHRDSPRQRVMMGHARCRTEHDLSDAAQFQAEIDVFVDRAAMQEKVREAAGVDECGAAHEAVAGAEPLDRAGFVRDRVVAEAQ